MSPERVFGRICLVFLAVVVVAAARGFGIRRPRDVGWQGGRWLAVEILLGAAVGLAMLGIIGVLSTTCGARAVVPPGWAALPARIPDLARFGFGAAAFEETFFRGLLLLAFVRAGRTRAGVVVTSLLYAGAHWLRAPGTSAETATPLSMLQGIGVALSGLPAEIVRWTVLFLAAVCLCIAVLRTGRIGWSVGLHAGWVMGLKAIVLLTDTVPDTRCPTVLFGDDGALEGVVALGCMMILAVALCRLRPVHGDVPCSGNSSG
jgi:membrane protease YdiL (CAAX protease family)